MYKQVCCAVLFVFLLCEHSLGMKTFGIPVTEAERREYNYLSTVDGDRLVEAFRFCCKNSTSLHDRVNDQLQIVANDPVGANILRVIGAKVNPYAMCADSLENLVRSILTYVPHRLWKKIEKTEKIVFFYSKLGIRRGRSFREAAHNTADLLFALKRNPSFFGGAIPAGILWSRIFSDDVRALIDQACRFWDSDVSQAVMGVLPLLREKMFSIRLDDRSHYSYDRRTRSCVISLSLRQIFASHVTWRPLCSIIGEGDAPFIHSYSASSKPIAPDVGLVHEMNHHLVISILSDTRKSFDEIIPFLRVAGVDSSYIVKLSDIFTNFCEFQDITGLVVKEGRLYYNVLSEGGYVISKKRKIAVRCAHTAKRFYNVPVELVQLIKLGAKRCCLDLRRDLPLKYGCFRGWEGF